MNKKHTAFSLIEALIILLLISVTIAGATPLITKKISLPKWSFVKTNDNNQYKTAINSGTDSYDRVGIGANPYQTKDTAGNAFDTQCKLTVDNMIIKNSTPSDYTSVFLGSLKRLANGETNNLNYYPSSNSILADTGYDGNMHWGNGTLAHSVILNANSSYYPATTNNILYLSTNNNNSYINATTYDTGTGKLDISTNSNNTRILLDKNNVTFTVNNVDVLSYTGDTDTLSMRKLNATYLIIKDDAARTPDSDNQKNCNNFVRVSALDTTITYCNATSGSGWWTLSDRRLKDIKSDYNKGINELSKLNTYYFTFKKDKKKTLYTGLIAQHLKGIFDIALRKNADGYYSYEKNAILYAMINGVKSINKKQNDIAQAQKDMNDEADRLIRMYK